MHIINFYESNFDYRDSFEDEEKTYQAKVKFTTSAFKGMFFLFIWMTHNTS